MQQVRDELGMLAVGQSRADHAGLAMVQGTHRVEEVGETGRAGLQRGHAVVIAAVAVADLHADARIAQRADQRQVAGHFGRQRQHANRCQRVQAQHLVQRRGDGMRRLGAQAPRVDVGAFQMHAEHARRLRGPLAADRAQGLQRGLDVGQRCGHRRGQQRGGAMPGMAARDGGDGVARLHRVAAAAAVHMGVDEARKQHGTSAFTGTRGVDGRASEGGNAAVLDVQVAGDHALRRDDVAGEPHQSRLISATKS
mmetsp:Transcript_61161/g.144466  ORF Transcript_61161/g.144466 Transcript_61161/m.144466 type:complete len:253 (-) Transcript_61161:2719-3477(-)